MFYPSINVGFTHWHAHSLYPNRHWTSALRLSSSKNTHYGLWLAWLTQKKKKKKSAGVPLTRIIPIMPTQMRIYTYTGHRTQIHTYSYISTYNFVPISDTRFVCTRTSWFYFFHTDIRYYKFFLFFLPCSQKHTHRWVHPTIHRVCVCLLRLRQCRNVRMEADLMVRSVSFWITLNNQTHTFFS